jgi:hypothetical protein
MTPAKNFRAAVGALNTVERLRRATGVDLRYLGSFDLRADNLILPP